MVYFGRNLTESMRTEEVCKNHYVGALLLTADGDIILQHRDDNPCIQWPNTWSLFGGGVEGDETYEEALARELQEELELDLHQHPFSFYKTFLQRKSIESAVSGDVDCHIFIVKNVDPKSLVVHEGQGYVIFKESNSDAWRKASPTMRTIVTTYRGAQ